MKQLNTFNNKSVRKIAETVRHVEGLPRQQGRGNQGRQKTYKARLTATINDPAPPNDPIPYQFEAEQVYWDGSAWQAVTDGLEWDSDKILYVYDSGEVGDIVNAELTSDGSTGSYWLALKPAGGGAIYYDFTIHSVSLSNGAPIYTINATTQDPSFNALHQNKSLSYESDILAPPTLEPSQIIKVSLIGDSTIEYKWKPAPFSTWVKVTSGSGTDYTGELRRYPDGVLIIDGVTIKTTGLSFGDIEPEKQFQADYGGGKYYIKPATIGG